MPELKKAIIKSPHIAVLACYDRQDGTQYATNYMPEIVLRNVVMVCSSDPNSVLKIDAVARDTRVVYTARWWRGKHCAEQRTALHARFPDAAAFHDNLERRKAPRGKKDVA